MYNNSPTVRSHVSTDPFALSFHEPLLMACDFFDIPEFKTANFKNPSPRCLVQPP